jgi:hypothetical protein
VWVEATEMEFCGHLPWYVVTKQEMFLAVYSLLAAVEVTYSSPDPNSL